MSAGVYTRIVRTYVIYIHNIIYYIYDIKIMVWLWAAVLVLVVVRVRKIELFYDRPVGFAYIIYYYYYDVINEAGNCAGLMHRVTVTTKAIKNKNKKKSDRPHDSHAKSPRDRRPLQTCPCVHIGIYIPIGIYARDNKNTIIFSSLHYLSIRIIIIYIIFCIISSVYTDWMHIIHGT